jgi:hypothetical protein
MMGDQKPEQDNLIKCEICMKEVPRSESKSAEVEDYVMHFCGLDCFSKWEAKEKKPRREE